MEDSDEEDGDALGLSFGEPRVVEGVESAVAEVIVLRTAPCWGSAVEAMFPD